MFDVGDKIVYPLHGAGTIEAIEEHEVLGKGQTYYILKLLMDRMRVMVPASSVERIKLRGVIQRNEVSKVIDVLRNEVITEDYSSDWRVRHANNLDKMKSGCIYKVAEVAKNLSLRHKIRGLSSIEKKLFDNAFSMIVSELSFAEETPVQEVITMIEEIL
ncbi:MAG: CarD family transcriptional regulator [bacterium]|nr:CarD family transcriptional regulator [bacterium]